MNDMLNERLADVDRPTVNYARITRARVDRNGNLHLYRGWRKAVFHPLTEWDGFRYVSGPFEDGTWIVEVTLLVPRLADAKELHVPGHLSQAPIGGGEGGAQEADRV